MHHKKGRPGKLIMCINDCKVYNSLTNAAQAYKITESAISKQINGHRKSVKGFYFKEISGNETNEELQVLQKDVLSSILNIEVIK